MPASKADFVRVMAWLGAAPFCTGLNAEQLRDLAGQLQVRPFAAGETLASAGDEVTEFWIVAEGELDSFLTDARGRESHLSTIRTGETVGEVVILEHSSTRPIRFTARTSGTLLAAPAVRLRDWVHEYPVLMQNLFRTLSARFKQVMGAASRRIPSPRLGIVALSPRGYLLAGRLVSRLVAAGERLVVWSTRTAVLKSSGGWPESVPIRELATTSEPPWQPQKPEVDRQIVVWTFESNDRMELRRLLSCDEVLWLLEPRDASETNDELRSNSTVEPELSDRVRIVWLLDAGTPVAPFVGHWDLRKPDLKVPVETTGGSLTRLEQHGLDRLVRVLRGISIGVALAGGGAKGMAHLGVLRALEAAGLSFDAVAGTSAGALVGIPYAAGIPPEFAVENFQRDLTPSRLFQILPKWSHWYLVYQFRRRAWEGMLRRYLHDWRLEQLPIPFSAVTVDLVQARTVVLREGDAVRAILESINLPIVSKPILRDGMALVDGGVLNNLPADVLAAKGVDFVVGVDVSSRIRQEFAGNRPETPTGQMKNASSIETVLRIFESQHHGISRLRNRAVDFWIRPDTSAFGMVDFQHAAAISAVGELAAQASLPELRQRLATLEQRLLAPPWTQPAPKSSDRSPPGDIPG